MLVKMKTSVGYKADTLNPGEVFNLPDNVATSLIEADMAESSKATQTREIMEAEVSKSVKTQTQTEPTNTSDNTKTTEERIAELCEDYTVEELKELYTEIVGKKPGNKKEKTLAKAIAEEEAKAKVESETE
jgi:methionyl-tRNA formyltransferase